uniref:Uncharacterized protein n=1 Tax=Arundo donax TaxID=35708 RepID=A0A0A8ZXW0_ARUDO
MSSVSQICALLIGAPGTFHSYISIDSYSRHVRM